MGKTTFCYYLNSAILRTWGTTKTKTTLSTKRVFDIFCFQEQKTVLENTKQTGPYILILIGLLKSLIKYPQLISQPYENKTICFYLGVSYCICCGFSLYYELWTYAELGSNIQISSTYKLLVLLYTY